MFLNKFQALKRDRFYIASLFLSVSAVLVFLSYIMYTNPREEPDFESKRAEDMQACQSFAEHKGFDVKKQGDSVLNITSETFTDPKFAFTAVESVILSCRNIELQSMCFGVEKHCSVLGTKLVLSYADPKVY